MCSISCQDVPARSRSPARPRSPSQAKKYQPGQEVPARPKSPSQAKKSQPGQEVPESQEIPARPRSAGLTTSLLEKVVPENVVQYRFQNEHSTQNDTVCIDENPVMRDSALTTAIRIYHNSTVKICTLKQQSNSIIAITFFCCHIILLQLHQTYNKF